MEPPETTGDEPLAETARAIAAYEAEHRDDEYELARLAGAA